MLNWMRFIGFWMLSIHWIANILVCQSKITGTIRSNHIEQCKIMHLVIGQTIYRMKTDNGSCNAIISRSRARNSQSQNITRLWSSSLFKFQWKHLWMDSWHLNVCAKTLQVQHTKNRYLNTIEPSRFKLNSHKKNDSLVFFNVFRWFFLHTTKIERREWTLNRFSIPPITCLHTVYFIIHWRTLHFIQNHKQKRNAIIAEFQNSRWTAKQIETRMRIKNKNIKKSIKWRIETEILF